MNHSDFYIGLEFWCGSRQWRCTDCGTRTIIAIRVDAAEIASGEPGKLRTRILSREELERDGWFNGPPYALAEHVFNECDLEGCELAREE